MLASGVRPDTQCWTILISIWARSSISGKEGECQAIYDRMVQSKEASPNAITYTAMLKLWYYSKDADQAKDRINAMYDSILSNHVALDDGAFKWLLTGLGKACPSAESYAKVEHLLSRMIAFGIIPNEATWKTVLNSSVVKLSLERVMKVFRLMRRAGVYLDGSVLDTLISALTNSPLTAQQKNSRMLIKSLRVLILDPTVTLDSNKAANILENLSHSAHSRVVAGVVTAVIRELLINTGSEFLLPSRAVVHIMRAYSRQDMLAAVSDPPPALPPYSKCTPEVLGRHTATIEHTDNELARWAERDFNRVPLLAERDAVTVWNAVQEVQSNQDITSVVDSIKDRDGERVTDQVNSMYSTTPAIAYMMAVWRRSRVQDGLQRVVKAMQEYVTNKAQAVALGNESEAGMWLEEDILNAFKEVFAIFANTIGARTKAYLATASTDPNAAPVVRTDEREKVINDTTSITLLEPSQVRALLNFFDDHGSFEEKISWHTVEKQQQQAAARRGASKQYIRRGNEDRIEVRRRQLRQQTFEYKLRILSDLATYGVLLLTDESYELFQSEHARVMMSTLAAAGALGLCFDEKGKFAPYLKSMLLEATSESDGSEQTPCCP